MKALFEAPRLIAETLQADDDLKAVAHDLSKASDVLFLGRGVMYPLAMEGALKLKEISYIHAEGYAAGELKHGPIALVDEETPVIALAPHGRGVRKDRLEPAGSGRARRPGGDDHGKRRAVPHGAAVRRVEIPACDPFIAPLVYAVPVQLLAYYTAVEKGTDVDQPRNLAKSVTVE